MSGGRRAARTDPRRFRAATPLGPMTAEWTEAGLARLSFPRGKGTLKLPLLKTQEGRRGAELVRRLATYFRTGAWDFGGAAVPLDLSAGTDFDRAVWRALRRIPAGKTLTYGEVARAVGRPGAARAVGNACGRNPVGIVVPCHRVVASSGIGGFGGGLAIKRRLLALEGVSV